jgi:hypothetical protein
MTKSVMQRLAKHFRPKSKGNLAILKKVSSAKIRLGLVAALLFVSAYAVETKAILSLETSQNLFEVMR